jgi:hypothetical protein
VVKEDDEKQVVKAANEQKDADVPAGVVEETC